ncbi:hypothetical protein SAMN05444392_1199 [Seinonella peptonophila]|uniref:Peptidase S9 prolyl oligopeptidase catalytic domain-containing protein n=1 Tax=Seinonella peptonophila TaxID=112248 RepID=A0A1M5B7Z1_9BACL|nr:prolyl oligopeptidase family serine peptidase [Seinonella peptonophila]SHF38302.1 hypothetical protein SAMN05444392_1199 [Seinonella peptonophila]
MSKCINKASLISAFLLVALLFQLFIPTSYAANKSYQEEKITFQSGTGPYRETLNGTVLVPNTSGLHPAIVLVHGAGKGDQMELRKEAEMFVRAGMVTLIYNKRTKGYSKTERSYQLLADDVIAAMKTISTRPDVDTKKIGLWGFSEGGWVAPLAASKSKQVAFMITIGAPLVKPLQQQTWSLENRLHHIGVTSDAMIQSLARNGAKFVYSAGLFPEAAYDPVPVMKQIKQPVLAIWGSQDRIVPPEESSQIMKKILNTSGNYYNTMLFLKDATHEGFQSSEDGFANTPSFTADYEKELNTWLDQVLKGNPPVSKVIGQTPTQERLSPPEVTSLHWYDSAKFQLKLILFFLIVFIGYFIIGIFNRKSKSATAPLVQKWAKHLAISGLVTVLLFWAYLLLIWFFGGQIVGYIMLGRSIFWLLIQLLTISTCLFTLWLIMVWWKNRTCVRLLDKIRFSLLVLGGIVLLPWALYWQLLFS